MMTGREENIAEECTLAIITTCQGFFVVISLLSPTCWHSRVVRHATEFWRVPIIVYVM